MRFVLWIAFTGENYHGWQEQAELPTVQGTLRVALEKLHSQPVTLIGCSRTDAGVHARSYCCHFDVARQVVPLEKLPVALNTLLPYDIVVSEARYAPEDFHARYSAIGKEYLYRILNSPQRDPFERGRSYHCRYKLSVDAMRRAARHIEGTHDFSAFKAMGSNDGGSRVRTVKHINITAEDSDIRIYVAADGFLYNMARIIAGTLLYVGAGKITPDDLPAIIKRGERKTAGITLPAHGLCLNKVFY